MAGGHAGDEQSSLALTGTKLPFLLVAHDCLMPVACRNLRLSFSLFLSLQTHKGDEDGSVKVAPALFILGPLQWIECL